MGQPLSVGWTVTNSGSGGTGNVPIEDSVYLSYDQVFSNTSVYIGTVTSAGGLAAGAHYNQSATLQLPSGLLGTFYVFVVADTNQAVYEQNPSDAMALDPTPLVLQSVPPADLVAGTVTIPATAVPGENITVTYQVTNDGANPANGSWTDSLYLSSTQTWSASDPLLGTVQEDQDLAAGASYTGTLTAPLPGVDPGSYYVIVPHQYPGHDSRDDARQQPERLADADLDFRAVLDARGPHCRHARRPAIGLLPGHRRRGPDVGDQLHQSGSRFAQRVVRELRRHAFPGQCRLQLPGAGGRPTHQRAHDASRRLLHSGLRFIRSDFAGKLLDHRRTGAVRGPSGGSRAGRQRRFFDSGNSRAQFDRYTSFELVGPAGQIVPATAVEAENAATAYVTFDLTGAAQGAYGVEGVSSTDATSELSAGLKVAQGTGGRLQTSVAVPSFAVAGSVSSFTVDYANVGDADLPAPLLEVVSPTDTLLGESSQYIEDTSLYFLGTDNSGGLVGTLRPGESETQPFYFQTSATVGTPYQFQLEVYTTADTAPIDWSVVESWFSSSYTSGSNWPAIFASLQNLVGPTWGDFVQMLDQNASIYNTATGFSANNPMNLVQLEVAKAEAAIGGSISGSLQSPDLSTPIVNLVVTRKTPPRRRLTRR